MAPKVAEKRIITDDIKPPGAKIPAGADIPIVRKNSGARMNPTDADVPMAALNISPGKTILPVRGAFKKTISTDMSARGWRCQTFDF